MTFILRKMLYQDSCFSLFMVCIVATVMCQYDDAPPELNYVSVEPRPLPPELVVNKTDLDMAIEDCMGDYTSCNRALGTHSRIRPICATDLQEKIFRDFDNLCALWYDQCKAYLFSHPEHLWKYLHDGPCLQPGNPTVPWTNNFNNLAG